MPASREEILERLTVEIGADATSLIDALADVNRETDKAAEKQKTIWQKATGAALEFAKVLSGVVRSALVAVSKELLNQAQAAIKNAAALSRMAQSTGVSVESLSTLAAAAKASGVEIEDLQKGIKTLGQKLTDTGTTAQRTEQILGAIGVSMANLKNQTPDEQLLTLADAFERSQDGAGKARVASELFGQEVGTKLVPFLNKGKGGIQELREEAKALGAEVGTGFAQDAARYEALIVKLGTSAESLGRTFGSAVLPGLLEIGDAFVSGAKQGGILNGVLEAGGILWTRFLQLGKNALQILELTAIAASVNIIEAVRKIPGLGEAFAGDIEGMKKRFGEIKAEREKQIQEEKDRARKLAVELEAIKTEEAKKAATTKNPINLAGVNSEEAARVIADREQKAKETLEARIQSVQKLTNAQATLQATQTGAFRDFTEHAKTELNLLAQKLDSMEAQAKANEQARADDKAIQDLRNQLAVLQAITKEEGARVEIHQKSLDIEDPLKRAEFERLSLLIQGEKDRQKAAEDAARAAEKNQEQGTRLIESLETLSQKRAREIEEIQLLAQTNETVRARESELIDATNKKFDELGKRGKDGVKGIADEGKTAAKSLQDGFAQFLFDPFNKGLDGIAKNFLDTMRKLIANQLAQKLFGGLFGGGGGIPLKRAAGGPIVGPGGPRSDRIPVYASNGEFMQPAHRVKGYGSDFMESIRQGRFPLSLARLGVGGGSFRVHQPRTPHYADGGLIAEPRAPNVSVPVDLTVANLDSMEKMKAFLASRQGRTVIVNTLGSDGGHEAQKIFGSGR